MSRLNRQFRLAGFVICSNYRVKTAEELWNVHLLAHLVYRLKAFVQYKTHGGN